MVLQCLAPVCCIKTPAHLCLFMCCTCMYLLYSRHSGSQYYSVIVMCHNHHDIYFWMLWHFFVWEEVECFQFEDWLISFSYTKLVSESRKQIWLSCLRHMQCPLQAVDSDHWCVSQLSLLVAISFFGHLQWLTALHGSEMPSMSLCFDAPHSTDCL